MVLRGKDYTTWMTLAQAKQITRTIKPVATNDCITAANIAPISLLKVPLRSSSADLHIRGILAAIGDRTHPHAPLKDSATLITRHSRLYVLSRAGAWSADVIISATLALAASASTDLLTSSPRHPVASFVDR